jgi:diguanylate cyclase (GGDEF)-like protein/PAS domain S-box-containing protein
MVVRLHTEKKRPFWAMLSAQKVQFGDTEAVMVALTDVTAQKLAEEAIRRSEEGIRTLFAAAPVALVLSRIADNTVVLANQRAADLFEVPLEEAVGQAPPEFWVNPDQRRAYLDKVRENGFVDNFTTHMRSRHGRVFWALLSARIVEFEDQPCLLGGVTDVSAQKALEEQLRDLATKDSLTEAYNRRHFLERADEEVRRSDRHGRALSLCMLDADHFKNINDEFGHAAGDVVLRELARICRSHLRANDLLARVGGEEFTLLLPETALSGARAVAERVRVELEHATMRSPEGNALRITASFGVAEWKKGENLDGLLRRADRALYAAKDAGRNRVVVDGGG